ncbi:MAG: ATP-binding protein [Candidatus Melainabacteria bacterium]|nr:ATP-binding protein [Candidatus Melainabacteria bacterium]
MRIEKAPNPHQLKIFSSPLGSEIKKSQNSDTLKNSNDVVDAPKEPSLRNQILLIQRAKLNLGLEPLAASNIGYYMQRLNNHNSAVFGRNSSLASILNNLLLELDKEKPISDEECKKLRNFGRDAQIVKNWLKNSILKIACDSSYTMGAFNVSPTIETREIAAKVFVRFLEWMGGALSDINREIGSLLESPYLLVRRQGAYAALKTYRLGKRYFWYPCHLASVLEKEKDDLSRIIMAGAIALADPKCILTKLYNNNDFSRLIELVLSDPNLEVRATLLAGLRDLTEAENKAGRYFKNFSEVPELTPTDRAECFRYSARCVEEFIDKRPLSEDEAMILNNSFGVIAPLLKGIGDESIIEGHVLEEYVRLKNRIAQLDLFNLVQVAAKHKFKDDSGEDIGLWENVSPVFYWMLLRRSESTKKPMVDYFRLKRKLSEKKENASDSHAVEVFNKASSKINDAIEWSLTKTKSEEIKWGDYTEFNLAAGDLFELLGTSENFCKLAVLNLIDDLRKNGLELSGGGRFLLHKALDDSNRLKLKDTLKSLIYSSEMSGEIVASPPATTAQGKALLVYREMAPSFKDYFGMVDLKERALGIALSSINSNRFSKGLLFSGAPGTGKSHFGEVLANELALPYELLSDGMITETEEEQLLIVESAERKYTLDQYIEKLARHGRCVVLVDEINKMANPGNQVRASRFLVLFQKLQQANLHPILIATTNFPILDNVNEFPIDEKGCSRKLDKLLKEFVHPDVFGFFEPCYLFHKKLVGYGFTKGYLKHLTQKGEITGDIDFEAVGDLAKGLRPLQIINTISEIPEHPFPSQAIKSELRKLKLDTNEIKQLQNLIAGTINILKLSIDGKLDLSELALAAEDIPTKSIAKILKSVPTPLTQTSLLELFRNYDRRQIIPQKGGMGIVVKRLKDLWSWFK